MSERKLTPDDVRNAINMAKHLGVIPPKWFWTTYLGMPLAPMSEALPKGAAGARQFYEL